MSDHRNARATVLGAFVGAGSALLLAWLLPRILFDSHASPTSGSLSDGTHAVLGAAIGLFIGSLCASVAANARNAFQAGLAAGVLAYVVGVLPVGAATTEGSFAGNVGIGMILLLPLLAPVALGALSGVALSSRRHA
jgi:hypothetical protein